MADEVARIGALSNGSNGQRSLESASLHFEPICKRERGEAEREPTTEILSTASGFRTMRALEVWLGCQKKIRRARFSMPFEGWYGQPIPPAIYFGERAIQFTK